MSGEALALLLLGVGLGVSLSLGLFALYSLVEGRRLRRLRPLPAPGRHTTPDPAVAAIAALRATEPRPREQPLVRFVPPEPLPPPAPPPEPEPVESAASAWIDSPAPAELTVAAPVTAPVRSVAVVQAEQLPVVVAPPPPVVAPARPEPEEPPPPVVGGVTFRPVPRRPATDAKGPPPPDPASRT